MDKETLCALVLRHGEAASNAQGIFRSRRDVPLTDKGKQQAKDAAVFLSKYPIKLIISSPLLRAFVTADIVSQPHHLTVVQHRGLLPWELGVFTGLDRKLNKDALDLFVKSPSVTVPNGESLDEFSDRQEAFWKAALENARRLGLTLLVCHNSVICELEAQTKGMKSDPVGETVKAGGVAALYWDGAHYRLEPIFGISEPSTMIGS